MPKKNVASFADGLVLLDVNTQGSNLSSFQCTNNDPARTATFFVYDTNGVVVWSFGQPSLSTSAVVPFPSTDNNGQPITWKLGTVTLKDGTTDTTVVSPPWSFTMV